MTLNFAISNLLFAVQGTVLLPLPYAPVELLRVSLGRRVGSCGEVICAHIIGASGRVNIMETSGDQKDGQNCSCEGHYEDVPSLRIALVNMLAKSLEPIWLLIVTARCVACVTMFGALALGCIETDLCKSNLLVLTFFHCRSPDNQPRLRQDPVPKSKTLLSRTASKQCLQNFKLRAIPLLFDERGIRRFLQTYNITHRSPIFVLSDIRRASNCT